jgi:hypothetical protein
VGIRNTRSPQGVKEQSSPILRAIEKGVWPFLLHVQDGRWYLNKAKRRTRAEELNQQANQLGEAKW